MPNNATQTDGGRWKMNTAAWPTERWVAVVVVGALLLLVAIRMGFRGVNVMGVRATVS